MDNAKTIIDTGKDIWTLVFLEDGCHLLSGGREETIRQWRVEDGREVEEQRLAASGHSQVTAIALSRDGNWIVSGGWQSITIWNRKTRQSAFTAREHSSWVNEVHVSPDSTRFATASYDNMAIIWNISNGRPLMTPLQHGNVVWSVRFSPDGHRIATAARDGELRIYNAHNGQLLSNIAVTLFPTTPIAWSSSQHIFALSSRNVLKHICVDTGAFLSEWMTSGQPQSDNFGSIAISSNGRFIASFVGRSLTFWDTFSGARFGPIFDHAEAPRLYSIALSPDNKYVATGGYGGIITLRRLDDIIPMSHRVGQPLQIGNGDDLLPKIEALRGILHALELRSEGSNITTIEALQTPVTPQRIPDGTYRIRSNIGNLYLTRSQDEPTAVIVQALSLSNLSQVWTISFADDAYTITGYPDVWLTVGVGAALLTGQKGTSWTFEPRGDAYVIGSAENISAIQLEQHRQIVSVLPRNNHADQRWVLEPVTS